MNGIAVYLGPEEKSISEKVVSVQNSLGHTAVCWTAPGLLMSRLQLTTWSNKDSGIPYKDKRLGLTAVVDGYFRESGSDVIAANLSKKAIELYSAKNDRFINHISGEFVIAIYSHRDRTLKLFNDRFGLRPVYWNKQGGRFICASGPRYLIETGVVQPRLNKTMALTYLLLNKVRPGEATIFSDIYLLPPATVLTLKGSRMTMRSYWNYVFTERQNAKVDVHKIAERYRRAVSNAVKAQGQRVVISLSGGLDSRSIVAGLNHEDNGRVGAMSWGIPDSDEMRLAEKVAEVGGLDFDSVPVIALDFVDQARSSYEINDEIDLFVQGITSRACKCMIGRYDAALVGIVLDATFGGSHLTPEVFRLKTTLDVLEFIKKKHSLSTNIFKKGVHSSKFFKEYIDSVNSSIISALSSLPQKRATSLYDSFFLRYAAHRLIFLRYRFYRHFVETSTPMYDYNFVDMIRKIPAEMRADHSTYRLWLKTLSPALAKISYQRTLLRADVPEQYWKEANRIQHNIRDLYDRIGMDQDGAYLIHYKRHYSNWLEWSKHDYHFRKFMGQLAKSKDAPVYDLKLASRTAVRRRWQEHLSGSEDLSQLFLHLNSLNGFLKRYF